MVSAWPNWNFVTGSAGNARRLASAGSGAPAAAARRRVPGASCSQTDTREAFMAMTASRQIPSSTASRSSDEAAMVAIRASI